MFLGEVSQVVVIVEVEVRHQFLLNQKLDKMEYLKPADSDKLDKDKLIKCDAYLTEVNATHTVSEPI